MAMANGKELLSDELLHQVEEAARAQHREPSELVADAVRKYLDEQSWVQFVERNERRARKAGVREEDVERLISEVRRENEHRR
jgi:metal-responsive CopG/Arc/MetJ family transcriptional regulator